MLKMRIVYRIFSYIDSPLGKVKPDIVKITLIDKMRQAADKKVALSFKRILQVQSVFRKDRNVRLDDRQINQSLKRAILAVFRKR